MPNCSDYTKVADHGLGGQNPDPILKNKPVAQYSYC